MLKFSVGNSKLDKDIAIFSLPAGWSCPFANECFSKANRETGKITDGKQCRFRCYAASEEARLPNVRQSRWNNFEQLKGKSTKQMAALIADMLQELPRKVKKVRIHESGDFFSQRYFDAWLQIAIANPSLIFYAYTKSMKFWVERKDSLPDNFLITASKGGKRDDLIDLYALRFSEVVYSEQEAVDKGLEIDHDDSHAFSAGPSFALLIHGTQPKGSEAGQAKQALKGKGSYGKGGKVGQ